MSWRFVREAVQSEHNTDKREERDKLDELKTFPIEFVVAKVASVEINYFPSQLWNTADR